MSVETRPTAVAGCTELHLRRLDDGRGAFLKLLQRDDLAAVGIEIDVHELFVSWSEAGVARGLHFQRPPADVAKVVWCLDGEVRDAVVDLRTDSPTYGSAAVLDLSASAANAVYVPLGCAHGFAVRRGPALVAYAQSGASDAELEGGILWSSAGVDWDGAIGEAGPVLSDRDAGFPPLDAFVSPFRLAP
jgi:dTDP-4-dehydrorhamnose 3,5-epimerase